MNTTELAANQFRMTQTREKLQKEKIKGQERAIRDAQTGWQGSAGGD